MQVHKATLKRVPGYLRRGENHGKGEGMDVVVKVQHKVGAA